MEGYWVRLYSLFSGRDQDHEPKGLTRLTICSVTPAPASHRVHVRNCVAQLSTDAAYFKRVYRHTFVAGKEADQKAILVENALVYWEMMFKPPGRPWASGRTDWLEAWNRFLLENWKRSVNRDMWNQTLEFARKTLEDETLSFWSESASWPSVIDQFVVWCRDNGVAAVPVAAGGGGQGAVDGMDVDR